MVSTCLAAALHFCNVRLRFVSNPPLCPVRPMCNRERGILMRIGVRLDPSWVSKGPRRFRGRGGGNRKLVGIVGGAIGLLIVGLATGCGSGAPAGDNSPASAAPASPVASVTSIVASTQPPATKTTQPARTQTAVSTSQPPAPSAAAPKPAPPAPARTTHAAAPAPPASTAPPASKAPASCYPLTNGGNCYEPGEYCRNSDHGVHGVAGDGEAIVCSDNDGWRWEPA